MKSGLIKFECDSVDETAALGVKLGKSFVGGAVIALIGTLGTGKTHLVKGIAQGLEVPDPLAVTSPTFTLINEYEGRLPLYHIDAYRLNSAGQLEELGFDEICRPPAIVVVEWADRVMPLVKAYDPIEIFLEYKGETSRLIVLKNMPNFNFDHEKGRS